MKLSNNLSFENIIQQYEEHYDCYYNADQVEQLRLGYGRVDISKYANGKYNSAQMTFIRTCLQNSLDATYLLDPKLTMGQMDLILKGLEAGINVSSYAKSNMQCVEMAQILKELAKQAKKKVNVEQNRIVVGHKLFPYDD